VYAEGTRSGDGRVARFKAGSFLLAMAGRPSDRTARHHRDSRRDGQGPPANGARKVRLVIHDPIQPVAIADPTVHDAKELAARVHEIVASVVRRAGGAH